MNAFTLSKTKSADYLAYRKEIIAERNLCLARMSTNMSASEKTKLNQNLQEKINSIFEKYKDKLHSEDVYVFNSLSAVEDFLTKLGSIESDSIDECVTHEMDHMTKAKKLGYEIQMFSCILLLTSDNKLTYAVNLHLDPNSNITYDDFKLIALAPETPSYTDNLI